MSNQIQLQLLADCHQHIPALATLWFDELGKQWIPHATPEKKALSMQTDLERNRMPLTYVALDQDQPIGMCSLREDDGLGSERTPWLGSLIVHPKYRHQGLARRLIQVISEKAQALKHSELYILVLDPKLPSWYERFGFSKVAEDKLFHHPVTVMVCNI